MHMNPRFLSREEVKPILPVPEYRRTHPTTLSERRRADNRTFEANRYWTALANMGLDRLRIVPLT